jgi:hypothetical protein
VWPKPATSNAKGRFTIAGLPRDKGAWLLVQGDGCAWQHFSWTPDMAAKEKTWTVSPPRLLEGKVVYEDTGKPAANARVTVTPATITSRADINGRFKVNLPDVQQRNMPPLAASAAEGEPYLAVRQSIVWPQGAVKHQVEVKLPRGVLVRGKVIEAKSGAPVAGAGIQFIPREAGNPNVRPNILTGWQHVIASGPDGSFQLAVLPGTGHLLISGPGRDFIHEEVGSRMLTDGKPGGYRLHADAVVKLELGAKSGPTKVTVKLRRGVTVRGRLLGPKGKPVARAQMISGLLRTAIPSYSYIEVQGGRFALHGCDPAKEYPVYFLDPEQGWGATVTLAGKRATGAPVTVRLAPCGRAVARFVDAKGKPLKNHRMKEFLLRMVITPGPTDLEASRKGLLAADEDFAVNFIPRKERVAWKRYQTDSDGRFTYPGLIPGATYRLSTWENRVGMVLRKEFQGKAEKTLDLGDIRIKQAR